MSTVSALLSPSGSFPVLASAPAVPARRLPSYRTLHVTAGVTMGGAAGIWMTFGWIVGATAAPAAVGMILACAGTALVVLAGTAYLAGWGVHIVGRQVGVAAQAVAADGARQASTLTAAVVGQRQASEEVAEQLRMLGRHVAAAGAAVGELTGRVEQVEATVAAAARAEAIIARVEAGEVVPLHPNGGPSGPRRAG